MNLNIYDRAIYTDDFLEAYDRWDEDPGIPDPENLKRKRLRAMKSPFLEKVVASAHPLFPSWAIVVSLICIAVAIQAGQVSLLKGALIYFVGFMSWGLVEYLAHRFIMHPAFGKIDIKRRMRVWLTHGYHHEFPEDPYRLVAPISLVTPFLVVLLPGCYLLLPEGVWYIYFGGLMLGYLAYDWVHYYTHHFSPKKGLGRFLIDHHAIHHYADHRSNFGISMPLWDVVFGTYMTKEKLKAKRAKERAEKKRKEAESLPPITPTSVSGSPSPEAPL